MSFTRLMDPNEVVISVLFVGGILDGSVQQVGLSVDAVGIPSDIQRDGNITGPDCDLAPIDNYTRISIEPQRRDREAGYIIFFAHESLSKYEAIKKVFDYYAGPRVSAENCTVTVGEMR